MRSVQAYSANDSHKLVMKHAFNFCPTLDQVRDAFAISLLGENTSHTLSVIRRASSSPDGLQKVEFGQVDLTSKRPLSR